MKMAMLPEANNEIAVGMNNLAVLLRRRGELEAAKEMYQQALGIQEQVLGPMHPEVAATLGNLASLMNAMDRNAEAIELGNRALAIRRQQYQGDHPSIALTLMNLGQWHGESGALDLADAELRESLAMRTRLLGADHPDLALSRMVLANHLVETGRTGEGCALAPNSVTELAAAFGDGNWRVAAAQSLAGACLHAEGRREESEAALLASLAGLDSAAVTTRRQALRRLVRLYEDWNRPQDASRYRLMLASL
jgi:tetratricopeptide (TPR) repeat protein